MALNRKRKYGLIKWAPNGVIGQAAQVAVDRYVESLGATIRTGGEIDLIKCNPQEKIDKNTRRMLRKASHILGDKTKSAGLGHPNSG